MERVFCGDTNSYKSITKNTRERQVYSANEKNEIGDERVKRPNSAGVSGDLNTAEVLSPGNVTA